MSSHESPGTESEPTEFVNTLSRSTEVPAALRVALKPWVDLEQVGLPGLWIWLQSVLPVLPLPSGAGAAPAGSRPEELAKALVDCSAERARLNFRAYEYYSDNVVLARRVRALEGMLRAAHPGDLGSPDGPTERTVGRYLPHTPDSAERR